jgi:hypothetical protein
MIIQKWYHLTHLTWFDEAFNEFANALDQCGMSNVRITRASLHCRKRKEQVFVHLLTTEVL